MLCKTVFTWRVRMTRRTYYIIFPIMMAFIIVSAFIISLLFPVLNTLFFLFYGIAGGLIIVFIRLIVKKSVDEPLADERTKDISRKALWLSFRLINPLLLVAGFLLIFLFMKSPELKYIGIGVVVTAALQTLIYSVCYPILEKRG